MSHRTSLAWARLNHPDARQFNRQRFSQLAAGVFAAACVGITQCFPIISNVVKSSGGGISQSDVAKISTAGVVAGYMMLPFGILYDTFGPKPVLLLCGLVCTAGYVLLSLIFSGHIAFGVTLMCAVNAMISLGASSMDTGSLMSNLYAFPLSRGEVIILQKTFVGLGSTFFSIIFECFFSKIVHRVDANGFEEHIDESNYSGFAIFMAAFVVGTFVLATAVTRLPLYHQTSIQKFRHFRRRERHVADAIAAAEREEEQLAIEESRLRRYGLVAPPPPANEKVTTAETNGRLGATSENSGTIGPIGPSPWATATTATSANEAEEEDPAAELLRALRREERVLAAAEGAEESYNAEWRYEIDHSFTRCHEPKLIDRRRIAFALTALWVLLAYYTVVAFVNSYVECPPAVKVALGTVAFALLLSFFAMLLPFDMPSFFDYTFLPSLTFDLERFRAARGFGGPSARTSARTASTARRDSSSGAEFIPGGGRGSDGSGGSVDGGCMYGVGGGGGGYNSYLPNGMGGYYYRTQQQQQQQQQHLLYGQGYGTVRAGGGRGDGFASASQAATCSTAGHSLYPSVGTSAHDSMRPQRGDASAKWAAHNGDLGSCPSNGYFSGGGGSTATVSSTHLAANGVHSQSQHGHPPHPHYSGSGSNYYVGAGYSGLHGSGFGGGGEVHPTSSQKSLSLVDVGGGGGAVGRTNSGHYRHSATVVGDDSTYPRAQGLSSPFLGPAGNRSHVPRSLREHTQPTFFSPPLPEGSHHHSPRYAQQHQRLLAEQLQQQQGTNSNALLASARTLTTATSVGLPFNPNATTATGSSRATCTHSAAGDNYLAFASEAPTEDEEEAVAAEGVGANVVAEAGRNSPDIGGREGDEGSLSQAHSPIAPPTTHDSVNAGDDEDDNDGFGPFSTHSSSGGRALPASQRRRQAATTAAGSDMGSSPRTVFSAYSQSASGPRQQQQQHEGEGLGSAPPQTVLSCASGASVRSCEEPSPPSQPLAARAPSPPIPTVETEKSAAVGGGREEAAGGGRGVDWLTAADSSAVFVDSPTPESSSGGNFARLYDDEVEREFRLRQIADANNARTGLLSSHLHAASANAAAAGGGGGGGSRLRAERAAAVAAAKSSVLMGAGGLALPEGSSARSSAQIGGATAALISNVALLGPSGSSQQLPASATPQISSAFTTANVRAASIIAARLHQHRIGVGDGPTTPLGGSNTKKGAAAMGANAVVADYLDDVDTYGPLGAATRHQRVGDFHGQHGSIGVVVASNGAANGSTGYGAVSPHGGNAYAFGSSAEAAAPEGGEADALLLQELAASANRRPKRKGFLKAALEGDVGFVSVNVIANPAALHTPFSHNLFRTPFLWAFWWVNFCVWGAGQVVTNNMTQIYTAIDGGKYDSRTNALFLCVMGIGGAVGRLAVGYGEMWVRKRKATREAQRSIKLLSTGLAPSTEPAVDHERLSSITAFLPLPPLVMAVTVMLLTVVPTWALGMVLCANAFAFGASWSLFALASREVFSRDIGKNYNFCFTSGIVAALVLNFEMFGKWYDAEERRQAERMFTTMDGGATSPAVFTQGGAFPIGPMGPQRLGAADFTCSGHSCISHSMFVLGALCCSAVVVAALTSQCWLRRKREYIVPQ